MIPPDQYHRLSEDNLVGDEVVPYGVDGLLKARCLGDDGLCDRGDGTGGLYGMPAGADVLGRVIVRDGGEGDGGVRGEFDDLLVVLERGKVDAVRLGIVEKVHNAHVRQPLAHRREGDLTLLAHDALKFITQIHLITSFSSYYTISSA